MNIILLTVDALRADHLSCYGYTRTTTPNIDQLADQGAQFLNAYSASSHTREAVGALLTGQYPHECVDDAYCLSTETVAAKTWTNHATGAFHSNPFISRSFGFDRDFDTFYDDLYLGNNRLITLFQRALDKLRNRHYVRADEINTRSLDWVESLEDRPFFLWNHYMDVHGPYEPPTGYRTAFHDDHVSDREAQRLYKRAVNRPSTIGEHERQTLIDLYDGEIRYTDCQIGALIDTLDQRGHLDDALVIITADHGDAFFEHGYYEHPRHLHDELIHVPLIVLGRGIRPDTVDTPVSILDVVPTVLDAIGEASDTLPGEPIQRVLGNQEEFADRGVIAQARGEGDNQYKLRCRIRTQADSYSLTCDIESQEIVEESGFDATLGARLEHHANQVLDSKLGPVTKQDNSDEDSLSPDIERRLDALGYKE